MKDSNHLHDACNDDTSDNKANMTTDKPTTHTDTSSLHIAVLALQGAFAEHVAMLDRLGVTATEIRNLDDWHIFISDAPADYRGYGIIIPGGESTAMTKIMNDEQLTTPIRDAIQKGMAAFGTCAGLIMLDRFHLGTMDIQAQRNAYGRQLGSFVATDHINGIGNMRMTFIRAPYIKEAGPAVTILATHQGRIVAARQGHQLVTAFHPELDDDTHLHSLFIKMTEE